MTVTIDVDGLEKFDKVGNEVILAELVLWSVEAFHKIDEGGEFKAFGIEFELSFQDFHILMGEHRHDALHVF